MGGINVMPLLIAEPLRPGLDSMTIQQHVGFRRKALLALPSLTMGEGRKGCGACAAFPFCPNLLLWACVLTFSRGRLFSTIPSDPSSPHAISVWRARHHIGI